MKWAFLSFALFAIATSSFAQNVAAPPEDKEISALLGPVRLGKQAIAAAQEKAVANLHAVYSANLSKLEAETQAQGNLDHVLLIRKEGERILTQEPVTPQDMNAMPVSLRKLRTSYDASMKKAREDAATRRDALNRKLLADLDAMQIRLTKAGAIERALLVKAEKEKLLTERTNQEASASKSPSATAASAPRPTPDFFSTTTGPKQAKVEVENTVLAPLKVGEDVLGFTKKLHWVEISDAFEGFQFTRVVQNTTTLKFKVLSDGIVYLACSNAWAASRPTGWESEVTTEDQLGKKGWRKERGTLKDEETHGWTVFTRNCKAGEEFSYRTAKYRTPVLLVK